MSTPALSISGLRKIYSGFRKPDTVAVDSLDLEVPQGGVFGFLGPNGAGKTTTIRCALGLVAPTEGQIRILGHDVADDLVAVMDQVGGLVESPKFFPTFSGRTNLELLASIRDIPRARVDEVLDEVGLGDRAGDRFDTYSLGMKQRLAVASTLLKRPTMLILDEPANGLDPAGIKDMRELIRRYGSSGSTVFVSSHQLAEVQLMCDAVAIIAAGRLVTAGSVDEVLSHRGATLIVTIDKPEAASEVLRREGWGVRPGPGRNEICVEAAGMEPAVVTERLASSGLYLSGLREQRLSLEEVFLELTGIES